MTWVADEANEARGIELKIPGSDIEHFLHARTGIEQREQERPIADVILSLGRDRGEHRADFVAFQVIYLASWPSLDRYGQQALRLLHLFGIPRC
jgi:hypothetical protein